MLGIMPTLMEARCCQAKCCETFEQLLADSPQRRAVVFFYSSCGYDRKGDELAEHSAEVCGHNERDLCRRSKQDLAQHRKDWKIEWRKQYQYLLRQFARVNDMYPELLFITVDLSRVKNEGLAVDYEIDPDQPTYILFKDTQEIARQHVNMKTPTESSLVHFIKRNFSSDEQMEKEDCRRSYDEFYPTPIKSYSVWDWGGPFYYNAMFPYSGKYYTAMLA